MTMCYGGKMKKGDKEMECYSCLLNSPENRNTTLTSFALFHIMLHMVTLVCYSFFPLGLLPLFVITVIFCNQITICKTQIFSFCDKYVNLKSKNWLSVLATPVSIKALIIAVTFLPRQSMIQVERFRRLLGGLHSVSYCKRKSRPSYYKPHTI